MASASFVRLFSPWLPKKNNYDCYANAIFKCKKILKVSLVRINQSDLTSEKSVRSSHFLKAADKQKSKKLVFRANSTVPMK